jgi:hypothetical protein
MSELFVASHGQTMVGITTGLSDVGRSQARLMAEQFANQLTDPDAAVIITSAAQQTRQVGNIAAYTSGVRQRIESPLVWQAGQSEIQISAAGLHILAHGLMVQRNIVPEDIQQVLVVAHPELTNAFTSGTLDPTLIYKVPDLDREGLGAIPVVDMMVRNY